MEGQRKLLETRGVVYQSQSSDQFFMERIDDLVRVEEMIVQGEEDEDAMDLEELSTIISRLNQ